MKTVIFSGKDFARKLEDKLYHQIGKLGRKPVMSTILVGQDPASKLYVELKQKAAARVGAQMDVYEYPEGITKEDLIARINHLDLDGSLDGMMIQLPLPRHLREDTQDIVNHIPRERDVDGMRENSPFVPATVRAVISILSEAKKKVRISPDAYTVVVGSQGVVGKSIVSELTKLGFEVGGVDIGTDETDFVKETTSADILISAVGKPNLIEPKHVKKGVIAIDIGSPKADVSNEVKERAKFITPVPGGVGPVTVVSLLANLVEASSSRH